jgi:hypothetical protein
MMLLVLTPGGGASTRVFCFHAETDVPVSACSVPESQFCAGSERIPVDQIKRMALRLLDDHFTDDIALQLSGFGCCRQLAGSSEITRG